MEKIRWIDRVKDEALHRVHEERNFLHTTKRRTFDRICHNLQMNRLLKHVTEGKIKEISDGKTKKKT
jgi:hypothetical protein